MRRRAIGRLVGALGILAGVAYGVVWVALAAAQGSRNTDTYVRLLLLTSPLLVVSAVGWTATSRHPAVGRLLLTLGGFLLAAWGLFLAIDIGPGWFLSGLIILAGVLPSFRRRSSAT